MAEESHTPEAGEELNDIPSLRAEVLRLRGLVEKLTDLVKGSAGGSLSPPSPSDKPDAQPRRASNDSGAAKKTATPVKSPTKTTVTRVTPGAAAKRAATMTPKTRPASTAASASAAAKTPAAKDKEEEKEEKTAKEVKKDSYNIGKHKLHPCVPRQYWDYISPKDAEGNVTGPSVKKLQTSVDSNLVLDFAYGYRGAIRNGLFYSDTGSLIYALAGLGMNFNPETREQKYFHGHSEDICSIAIHPNRQIAASGQLDPKGAMKPYACIWDTRNGNQLCRLGNFHDRGIIALAFSPDGHFLVTVGNDENHAMGMWKWESGKDTSAPTPKSKDAAGAHDNEPVISANIIKGSEVYSVSFNPFRAPGMAADTSAAPQAEDKDEKADGTWVYEFVSCGAKTIKYFNVFHNPANSLKPYSFTTAQPSAFNVVKVTQKFLPCVLFIDASTLIVGTESGSLYVFVNQKFSKQLKGHNATVGALCATPDGFASVGNDHQVKIHGKDLTELHTIPLSACGAGNHSIQSMSCMPSSDPTKYKLALGSAGNAIFELNVDTAKIDASKGEAVMLGHTNEIWGLAVCPNKPFVVTAAYDQSVRLWDYSKKSFVPDKYYKVTAPPKVTIHSAAFHPSGNMFAVGWFDGTVDLVDLDTFKPTKIKSLHKEQVECLAFSPDGKWLATGSFDQCAAVIDVNTRKHYPLKGHTSSIMALTWSADSKFLMTNSKDCESLYWDVEGKKRIYETTVVDKVAIFDKEWSDWTCLFGWCLQGLFQHAGDISDVNCVHISGDAKTPYRVVATGDDQQMVNLFRYPVMDKKQICKQFSGHSSHATRVRFSPDSSLLFSVGGLDCSLFQWKHVMSESASAANASAAASASASASASADASPSASAAVPPAS